MLMLIHSWHDYTEEGGCIELMADVGHATAGGGGGWRLEGWKGGVLDEGVESRK